MSIGCDQHSSHRLAEIAKRWGYDYDMLSIDGEAVACNDDRPLLNGTLATMELPCGVRLCASDLVAVRDNERAGTLRRSLTVILMLEGVVAEYTFGLRNTLVLDPGCAAVVAVADSTRIASCHRRGERSRCLVVHVHPADLEDEECAEQADRALRSSAVMPLPVSSRLSSLANGILTSPHTGVVGRLLAESCALELLAGGLATIQCADEPIGRTIGRQDITRMLRVRDKLAAELDRAHSLSDLARAAGVSVSTLKSKFHGVVGQSVFAFLRDQRLERARRGLACEGWTVSQAAYFVGYRHPTNFATAFRKKFGISPTATPRH